MMKRPRLRVITLLWIFGVFGFVSLGARTANGQPALKEKDKPTVTPSEGEKLLLEMERKLLEAKSLRIAFEIEIEAWTFTGVLETDSGNRCRTEVSGVFGKDVKNEITGTAIPRYVEVSDGIKNRVVEGEIQYRAGPTEVVSKGYNELLVQIVGSAGLFFADQVTRANAKIDLGKIDSGKQIVRGKFKAVVKEKLGDRDALKVEFEQTLDKTINPDKKEEKFVSVIWVDATTKLPLRRVIKASKDGKELLVETYTTIEINPKVDPKRFVLPMDK